MPSKEQLAEIKRLISTPRLGTYLSVSPDELSAIELYAWNARLSGVLLPAFHMCEVGLRNSVSEALSKVYGERWPWNNGFRRSLPTSKKGYSQKDDLTHKAAKIRQALGNPPQITNPHLRPSLSHRFDATKGQ